MRPATSDWGSLEGEKGERRGARDDIVQESAGKVKGWLVLGVPDGKGMCLKEEDLGSMQALSLGDLAAWSSCRWLHCTGLYGTVLHNTALYSTILYNTALYNTVLENTVLYN